MSYSIIIFQEALIIEFSALFVVEWGIQIIGASQSCSALELVVFIKAISSADEAKARERFIRMRRFINISLFILALTIVSVPISFIGRSTKLFNDNDRNYEQLIMDSDFLVL